VRWQGMKGAEARDSESTGRWGEPTSTLCRGESGEGKALQVSHSQRCDREDLFSSLWDLAWRHPFSSAWRQPRPRRILSDWARLVFAVVSGPLMLNIRRIDSLDMPGLSPYRTLQRTREHMRDRLFVVHGEKTVQLLLGSGFVVVSLLVSEAWLERVRPLCEKRSESIDVYIGTKALLQEVVGHSMYQPILAVGKIPLEPTLEQVLMRSPRPYLFVAFDGISNAENLGALVRNCAAFGAQALLVGETSGSPYIRRSVRASMGSILRLPAVHLNRLDRTLAELCEIGVKCVAAHPRSDSRTAMDVDLTGDCCLVFGSEGDGISKSTLAVCDERAALPQTALVDSLNVANAGAALLYEVWRQRGRFSGSCAIPPFGAPEPPKSPS